MRRLLPLSLRDNRNNRKLHTRDADASTLHSFHTLQMYLAQGDRETVAYYALSLRLFSLVQPFRIIFSVIIRRTHS